MYEPMKQVTEKFPLWLEQNKNKITEKEWNQRNNQYECFQKLVQVYEEQDNNNNNEQTMNTGRLLELMQQVQEYGQPPSEIINEIAPGLELDEDGLPKMNGGGGGGGGGMSPLFNMMAGGNKNPGEGGEDCQIM